MSNRGDHPAPFCFFSQLISFPFKKYGISSLLELGLYSLSPSIPSLTSNLCFPLFWNCSFILFCLFPIVIVCQLIPPLLNSSYASSKDRREIDCLLGSQAFERLYCRPSMYRRVIGFWTVRTLHPYICGRSMAYIWNTHCLHSFFTPSAVFRKGQTKTVQFLMSPLIFVWGLLLENHNILYSIIWTHNSLWNLWSQMWMITSVPNIFALH